MRWCSGLSRTATSSDRFDGTGAGTARGLLLGAAVLMSVLEEEASTSDASPLRHSASSLALEIPIPIPCSAWAWPFKMAVESDAWRLCFNSFSPTANPISPEADISDEFCNWRSPLSDEFLKWCLATSWSVEVTARLLSEEAFLWYDRERSGLEPGVRKGGVP